MMEQPGQPVRSAFSDDPEMQQFLERFVAELPERVDALAKALSDEAHEDLVLIAHQLKGAGDGCGFAPISDAARTLEDALRESSLDTREIRKALDDLADCCARAVV